MATKHSKFVIKRSRAGYSFKQTPRAFRFNLVAANGEVVATSERYPTKGTCKKGIRAVMRAVYDLKIGSEISDET